MVRLDLPGELDLAAAERSAGTKRTAPRAIESEQLPDPVDAEAAGLHGIAAEVAGEIPIVGAHVALRDQAATRPSGGDLDDAVDHEQRRQRQPRAKAVRRILDQTAVGEAQ